MSTKINVEGNTEREAQHAYVEKMEAVGFDYSLMVAGAFVRGIRDLGYKSTATAMDELVDNSVQAGAENIHVIFNTEGKSNNVSNIAVIDDGHGMSPGMVRLSMIWGGTHRENNRDGFGRYGYGLPSASVSQGKRFEVFSREEDGTFYKGWVDLDEIAQGKHFEDNKIIVPEPSHSELLKWVEDYLINQKVNPKTVIVIDKLDKLTWKTYDKLTSELLAHFGIVYRNYLRRVNILVNGIRVDPVDPLFTTPGARYFDLDEDRAESLDPVEFEVKDKQTKESLGIVRLRYSYMPPTFQRLDKLKETVGTKNGNARFPIMKDHNGIIILRNGRQIDVVTSQGFPYGTFINYDRNWGVEIDFPATLDEEFSITTSKQQIRLSPRMWQLLENAGLTKAIRDLRSRYKTELAELKARHEVEEKRASESAMEETSKFKKNRPGEETESRKERGQKGFEEEVNKRARSSGKSEEQAAKELQAEMQGHSFRVQVENSPGAPFYRVQQVGGGQILYLNAGHRFYTDVYAAPDSTPRLRASLEVLLFVLGDCELDAVDERYLFYQTERAEWSQRLSIALDRLETHISSDEEPAEVEEPDFEPETP